ncbi:MAG: cryptochrome/photolyase family protein [Steroidobacteraceae bacterium]
MSQQRRGADSAPRPVILWFRNDLRLGDNPALAAALATGSPLVALYILDETLPGGRPLGGAARWWLHHSLAALDAALRTLSRDAPHGVMLCLRQGASEAILREVIGTSGAKRVFCNRTYDPLLDALDESLTEPLLRCGAVLESLPGAMLAEPGALRTGSGGPFKVFTAFWNRLSALEMVPPLPIPRKLTGSASAARSERLEDWGLLPGLGWDGGFARLWTPGEKGARVRLREFLGRQFDSYRAARDVPSVEGTSRLSPHLCFGEISARQIWHTVLNAPGGGRAELVGNGFLRELGWREFARYTLHHFPSLPLRPLRQEFEAFGWRDDSAGFEAWCRGRTGYPIVDAGMRQLWHTGWMHNRVRMIVGSFLVKDLLVPWQRGEAWFWDTLLDADRASNALNWQWVSGCGVDAAPYFRIFNPVAQSERFDPEGEYLRCWLPELRALPAPAIHAPWEAPPLELLQAGVRLGDTYPRPIVEHDEARKRALARFEVLRQRS